MDYRDDVDEGVFDLLHEGKAVYCPKVKWSDKPREEIIIFDPAGDMAELMNNPNIGENAKAKYKDDIINIIQYYWYCFCLKGACRTILYYEFAINIGVSKPVCCCRTTYGPHGKPIIMEQISSLFANDWIEKCG